MHEAEEEVSRLTALLERKYGEQFPAEKPKLRLITTADLPAKAPRLYTDDEHAWICNEIRMWCRVYPIEPYVRRHMRGYVAVEEMPDAELRTVFEFVERAVQCYRDGVAFDEAGIL